ncbi:MAG: hypothetical protein LBG93_00775 [Treponema sp.]|jgi:hypothetical protein|nr:hypothetical protein [Treponema sp.]
MKLAVLFLSIFLAFGFFSCSRAEPRILYGFMEKTYIWGIDGSPVRQYSFFILPEDDDGIENLSELYVFHDREGLRWRFASEDWVQFEDAGRVWIGTRNIAMRGGEPLPRGQFRAVLINLGGERTERVFAFDIPESSPHPFPAFHVLDGLFRLDSSYPVNRLLSYDVQGEVIQTITLTATEGYLEDLNISLNAIGVSLWAEDPLFRISALTQVVLVR